MSDTPTLPSSIPGTVRVQIGVSWVLGWLLLLDGTYQRLANAFLPGGPALWPWTGWVQGLGFGPLDTGWPWLCVGATFLGASFGLYLGRRWGYALTGLAAVLTLAYALPGTFLAVLCLILLAQPATRGHIQPG